mgnify:CR=1 FL=1
MTESAEQHRFFNACMSLMNIDMHELVAAGIIKEGNFDNGGSSYKRFSDDPLIFLAKIDDRKRDALWKLLEARQRVIPWRDEATTALKQSLEYLRGDAPGVTSGSHRNGDLRARIKWVLLGCGGPLRTDAPLEWPLDAPQFSPVDGEDRSGECAS